MPVVSLMVRIGALFCMATVVGCTHLAIDLSERSCNLGDCIDGFACHPLTEKCVPAIVIDCDDPSAYCAKTTNDGDTCTDVGAFLPCDEDVTDCSEGCRTCEPGGWGPCEDKPCTTNCQSGSDGSGGDDDGDGDTPGDGGTPGDSDTPGDGGTPGDSGTPGDVDDLDLDNDGINDANDPEPDNPDICGDSDGDTCDDCAIGSDNRGPAVDSLPNNDGLDTDGDGACDDGDTDDDNDGVDDGSDLDRLDRFVCQDLDGDFCDDCSVTGGPPNQLNDGADTNGGGVCDYFGRIYRRSITIDRTKVSDVNGADLSSFPVVVRIVGETTLATVNAGGHVESPQGADILFVDANGATMDQELERFDGSAASQHLVAWVRVPQLTPATDTLFYIYYGGPSISSTGNPAAVWDASYRLVLHMADATIARVDDSTANGNDAAKGADAQPNQVDGKIGWGQLWDEDSNSEWLQVADHSSIDTGDTFTAAIWVNYSRGGSPNDYERMLTKKRRWDDGDGWEFSLETDYNTRLTVRGASGTGSAGATNVVTSWAAGGWQYLTIVYSGTVATVYRDGIERSTVTIDAADPNNGRDLFIGRYGDDAITRWKGKMDEIRLSNGIRSPDWIRTSFLSQNAPETFCAVGAEE